MYSTWRFLCKAKATYLLFCFILTSTDRNVVFIVLFVYYLNIDSGLVAKSQLWAYGYLTGKKLGTHSQDCTSTKFCSCYFVLFKKKILKSTFF